VLDNAWVTLIGVLLTFALLVQFASVLSDVERSPGLLQDRSWLRTFVANPRRLVESLVDFALITASFAGAYYLRLQGGGSAYERHIFLVSLAVLLAVRYAAFIPFGLYRGVWRYAGARDAAAIVGAVVVSEVVAYLILDATQVWGTFPRSVFIIDALLCTILVGASRFWERAFVRAVSTLTGRSDRRRTLIVGAGRGGRSLLRELRETTAGCPRARRPDGDRVGAREDASRHGARDNPGRAARAARPDHRRVRARGGSMPVREA
jgi:hypothetical protein